MLELIVAAAIVVVALVVAEVVRRRRQADPPTQPRAALPAQIDRADFAGAGWLVVVFSSDSCSTCAAVIAKAAVLASDQVTVATVSFQARPDLHRRYRIDSVPGTIVADPDGAVRAAFVGPVSAADLWASVADARDPGSAPRTGCH